MAGNTSLQNKNWLFASKNVSMYPVYIKEKCVVLVSKPFPYNFFIYFLEGQARKIESKLEVMTNVGKSYLEKHSQNE